MAGCGKANWPKNAMPSDDDVACAKSIPLPLLLAGDLSVNKEAEKLGPVDEWLNNYGLLQYSERMREAGFTTLKALFVLHSFHRAAKS